MKNLMYAALTAVVGVACSNQNADDNSDVLVATTQRVAGNIHPFAIQVDGPANTPPGADLFAHIGAPLNAGATADWVKDSLPNAGTSCLGADGIATCVEANVTGAAGGVGHWNGLRIVDGIASSDADIFLTGGKENIPSTWNVGPGTVGSSKYDLVQAYLANNQNQLFFGMERRGNNGTTAFDFEFNQLRPKALPSCPQSDLVPCRSVGDVLFTFEMQGSGSSGSAVPHVYTWDGSSFVEGAPTGILSSINNSTTTAGGPWGHVSSHGNWVLGNLDRFTFAESVAPISLLPGVSNCGGRAFVQVRTRSSSTATSDLKDTSKIFEFVFNSVSASARLAPSCDAGFGYEASAVDTEGNPIVDPVCEWTFSNGATSNTCSGSLAAAAGTVTGTVKVSHPSMPACAANATTAPVNVYEPIQVSAALTATCSSSFTYEATVTGGSNPAAALVAWAFSGAGTVNPTSSSARTGTVAVGTPGALYSGVVEVTDSRSDIECKAQASGSARPYAPLQVRLNLVAAPQTCPSMTSDAVTYQAQVQGGDSAYSYSWNGMVCTGTSCTVDPSELTYCASQSLSLTVSDTSGLCPPATSETETYSKVTTITASDN